MMSVQPSETSFPAPAVMSVDFDTAPVVTDFANASSPKNEIAIRLAAEAREQSDKVAGSTDKKAGTLRLLSAGRGDLFHVNPYLLTIKDGWNSREANDPTNIQWIDDLARSISEIGVQEPLTVVLEGETIYVTNGHCRLLATFRAIEVYGAEIKSVPLRAESRLSTPADHVLRQLLTGKSLSVLEQGNAFKKLIAFGWTAQQIAAKAGIGATRVAQILDLMASANDGIKSMVLAGSISASTAASALREAGNDAEVAEVALTKAVDVAKASGKTKATAKHVSAAAGKLSIKAALAKVFLTAVVESEGDESTITLSNEDWANVKSLLGIG